MTSSKALRPLYTLLSPAGPRARLSILIFHRVLRERDPLFPGEVTADEFSAICSWVARWFHPMGLDVAARKLSQHALPARALAITFDDGYADNHEVAVPILKKFGLPATFFIATGFLDGGRMWNDTVIEAVRRTSHSVLDLRDTVAGSLGSLPVGTVAQRQAAIGRLIPATKHLLPETREAWVAAIAKKAGAALLTDLMMRSDQVLSLHRQGMGVGAHTVTHPILATLSAQAIEREVLDGRNQLESIIGERVGIFAYPTGRPGTDYGPEAVDIVRRLGFDAAVSTAWGAASAQADLHQLPRFTPWDRTRIRFGLRMAKNLVTT
jgi:peptidoglycan/xylan/chitin deacetylase (PgdA/CDA1 family)